MKPRFSNKQYETALKNIELIPDKNFLNECFELKNDGHLYWKIRPLSHFKGDTDNQKWHNENLSSMIAGSNKTLRRFIKLDGIDFLARHLIIKMITGKNPVGDLI
jgi:hypothetical protein